MIRMDSLATAPAEYADARQPWQSAAEVARPHELPHGRARPAARHGGKPALQRGRASLELASVSKHKGIARNHDAKVPAAGGAQSAKIAFAIVQVAKRGI